MSQANQCTDKLKMVAPVWRAKYTVTHTHTSLLGFYIYLSVLVLTRVVEVKGYLSMCVCVCVCVCVSVIVIVITIVSLCRRVSDALESVSPHGRTKMAETITKFATGVVML